MGALTDNKLQALLQALITGATSAVPSGPYRQRPERWAKDQEPGRARIRSFAISPLRNCPYPIRGVEVIIRFDE